TGRVGSFKFQVNLYIVTDSRGQIGTLDQRRVAFIQLKNRGLVGNGKEGPIMVDQPGPSSKPRSRRHPSLGAFSHRGYRRSSIRMKTGGPSTILSRLIAANARSRFFSRASCVRMMTGTVVSTSRP